MTFADWIVVLLSLAGLLVGAPVVAIWLKSLAMRAKHARVRMEKIP